MGVTGNDCASKLFMGLMLWLYTGQNVDYGSILWAQLIQSTHSVTRHSGISYARFWTIVVNRAIKQLKIPLMSDALMASIATLHTTSIIMADRSKFSFVDLIPEAMFRDVPPSGKILEGCRSLTPSGCRPLTDEFQAILAEADKTKKGGRGSKKAAKKDTGKEGPSEAAKPPSKKKQPAKRRKSLTPSSSQSEGDNSESNTKSKIRIKEDPPIHNEEDEPVRTEEQEYVRIEEVEQVRNEPAVHTEVPSPNREVTPPLNDYVPSPPPSLKTTTSIPITIAPPPPPISSQLATTIPVSIPMFIESTISSHTSTTPISFSSHVTPPISPIRTNDPEMIFGDDEDDDLDGFAYSPFQTRIDGEDEVSTMIGELKSLHEKIDQLILASNSILERVMKEHTANVSTLSKVVSDSTDVCKTTTKKVGKLIVETIEFMGDYKNTYNANTVTANKAIQNAGTIKANFVELRKAFQSDHDAFYSSITAKITKLQEDLATENKIMDALALKEEKCKVLENKLHYTTKQVDDLLAEKAVTRSCISNMTRLLFDIIETCNPMISIIVKKHSAEKLRPVFAMLHRLEGVSTSMSFLKQGGEGSSKVQTNENPKAPIKPPVIKQEPKRKEKLFNEEPIIDDSEDEEPNEIELKRRKARKVEIDEHTRIVKEAEEKERAEKEAQATLKSKMLLFPKWTLKRIQNQAVDMPSQYWLDPITSFEIQNTKDSQLELPITPKAFRFCAFVKVANVTFIDSTADQLLFAFYLKHIKPRYETWSASKIVSMKVTGPIETESFPNAKLKVARGSTCQAYEFTLADLPCLNPHDWMIEGEVRTCGVLSCTFNQVIYPGIGMMDVDIATVLRQKPSVVPKEAPKDFEKFKPGKIYKEGWFMVYTSRDFQEANRCKLYFHLEDKHLFTTTCLEFISELVARFKDNNKDDVKCFTNVITCYIQVCKLVLSFITKVYEVQKRIKN
uniref:Uncharacterized protein n=1 Tax=Lactuca sativa TaxID=4236 RepID=A0A9R1VXZ3_LACSA|nr:hypothetical protein LSAT_V11C400221470 [Lactuca sativa]